MPDALPAVIRDPMEWKRMCRDLNARGTLGFVPTMGALHAGHESLCARAARENENAVASIFVNPTQFNDPKDLAAYPRVLDSDLAVLARSGVKAVFSPNYDSLYPDDYRYKATETSLSRLYCGAHRPGHFDGVLTVVLKLLVLTQADKAYFGEKDFQQYLLVRGLAEAFFLDTEIVSCPIVREPNGLAMSSRNERLSPEARESAAEFNRAITEEKSAEKAFGRLLSNGFSPEYVEDLEDARTGTTRRIAAVHSGGVRLIDNVPVDGRR